MDANVPCKKCLDMRCGCEGKFPSFPTHLGIWSGGPSRQGAWCTCCVQQFVDLIKADNDVDMATLASRFLVTLAHHPDRYVREEPADPTGWTGDFPCWHPTNCGMLPAHIEKLKKSRSRFFSRVSKAMTGFNYAYWPFSYDQLAFAAPFPYIMTSEVAAVILGPDGFDPAVVWSNPSVILPGGNQQKCPIDYQHE
jgi:hypothetical protein